MLVIGEESGFQRRFAGVQEPAVQNHFSSKPSETQETSTQQTDYSRRKMAAEISGPICFRPAEPCGDQLAIAFQLIAAVISFRRDNSLRRQQTGFNGWPDALAALRIGQPGGIAR